MKKRVLFIIALLSLNLISAYNGYGYGSFSLRDFLDSIEPSNLILGTLFLIFFAVINFALGKFFRDKEGNTNKAVSAVVSLGVSLLLIYYINRSGYDYESFIYTIGVPQDVLWTLIPWIIIAGLILLFWKLKSKALLAVGGILILTATFTDLFYERNVLITIGAILIIGWILWTIMAKKGRKGKSIWEIRRK